MGMEARTWVSDIVLDSGTPTATDQFAQCSIQLEHFRRSVPLVGAAQIEPCLTAKARSRCSIASGCAHCVVRRNDDKSATMAFVVVKYPISDWAIWERTNRPVAATDACHVPALQRENGRSGKHSPRLIHSTQFFSSSSSLGFTGACGQPVATSAFRFGIPWCDFFS